MKISAKGYIYHKTAEKFVDCFDRYGYNLINNKFAISDGVSKSFFPDIWAELLVENFIHSVDRVDLSDFYSYKILQNEWVKRVGKIVVKPDQKYFVKNFFIEGRSAAATFVGLHFFKEENILKWEAVALGDSFLFFVPDNDNNQILYFSSKEDLYFNNFPDFFDSRNVNNKGKIKQKKNELKKGTFYLMTDALAEWFIINTDKAINIINQWQTQNDFEDSIKKMRMENLNNDDSTILKIVVEEDYVNDIQYGLIDITNYNDLLEKERQETIEESYVPEKLETDTLFEESLINNKKENLDIYHPDKSGVKKKSTDGKKEKRDVGNELISENVNNGGSNLNESNKEVQIYLKSHHYNFFKLLLQFLFYRFHNENEKIDPSSQNKRKLQFDDEVKSTTDKF